jgi:hypothetical protein
MEKFIDKNNKKYPQRVRFLTREITQHGLLMRQAGQFIFFLNRHQKEKNHRHILKKKKHPQSDFLPGHNAT